jgi:hypothetical protein
LLGGETQLTNPVVMRDDVGKHGRMMDGFHTCTTVPTVTPVSENLWKMPELMAR